MSVAGGMLTPSVPLNPLHSLSPLQTPSLYLWCTQNSKLGLTTLTLTLGQEQTETSVRACRAIMALSTIMMAQQDQLALGAEGVLPRG